MPKKEKYRILGVDPGSNVLGYAILDVNGQQTKAVVFDVISMARFSDHHEKLRHIFEELVKVIAKYKPDQMAVEAPFYGKNVQSMLKLGRAQGVAIAAGITRDLTIAEYSPKKIKQSVTGKGNASKEQVAAMLKHTLAISLEDSKLDATDALATALCHYYQSKKLPGAGKSYSGWDAFLKDNPDRVR
ncbi:MAG: crossover junction endodeoxyribonuclease RuvC [Saprospiraceae bacterium]